MSSELENWVVHGPALEGIGMSEANNVVGRPLLLDWKLSRLTRGRRTRNVECGGGGGSSN